MKQRDLDSMRAQMLTVLERATGAPERILKEAADSLGELGDSERAALARMSFLRHRTELEMKDLIYAIRVLLNEYIPERR